MSRPRSPNSVDAERVYAAVRLPKTIYDDNEKPGAQFDCEDDSDARTFDDELGIDCGGILKNENKPGKQRTNLMLGRMERTLQLLLEKCELPLGEGAIANLARHESGEAVGGRGSSSGESFRNGIKSMNKSLDKTGFESADESENRHSVPRISRKASVGGFSLDNRTPQAKLHAELGIASKHIPNPGDDATKKAKVEAEWRECNPIVKSVWDGRDSLERKKQSKMKRVLKGSDILGGGGSQYNTKKRFRIHASNLQRGLELDWESSEFNPPSKKKRGKQYSELSMLVKKKFGRVPPNFRGVFLMCRKLVFLKGYLKGVP
jgi:hypothetical protein